MNSKLIEEIKYIYIETKNVVKVGVTATENLDIQIREKPVKNISKLKYLGTIITKEGKLNELCNWINKVITLYRSLNRLFFRKQVCKKTKKKFTNHTDAHNNAVNTK